MAPEGILIFPLSPFFILSANEIFLNLTNFSSASNKSKEAKGIGLYEK